MTRFRHIAGAAALALGGFLVAGLLAEGVLRWLLTDLFVYRTPAFDVTSVHPDDRGIEMREPLLGAGLRYVDGPWAYGLKRDLRARLVSSEFDVAVRTNSDGLRGPEIAQLPHAPRILGLGDSFAMGFGVEEGETYLAVLGRRWPGGAAETVNAGVVGYAPGNSVQFLLHAGLDLRPDLVLLQLWVVDDLCLGRTVTRPEPFAPLPPARAWRERVRRSHLAMFLRDRMRSIDTVRAWFLERNMAAPFAATQVLTAGFDERCGHLDELGELLAEADAAVRAAGSRFVILLLPAREQVYPTDLARALAYNLTPPEAADLDLRAPNRAFGRVADRYGLEVIDVLDSLLALRAPERLYFSRYDPHLTAAGHLAVGRLVGEHLAAHPTAPRRPSELQPPELQPPRQDR